MTYTQCLEKGLTWFQIIKILKPNTSDIDCQKIYDESFDKAYKDAVSGRRLFVTEEMIFDIINNKLS